VDTTATYTLTSSSTSNMDTHRFLYNDTFYPSNPNMNLLLRDDDSGGNGQFRLTAFLEAGVPYTLVVSTHGVSQTGPFSVITCGPGDANYFLLDPLATTTTSTTTRPSIIYSNYSSILTIDDGNFTRGSPGYVFYYEAIEVRVPTTGDYTFKSSGAIADTYGYLYQGNFYPSYPTYNVVTQDDDRGGAGQFQMTATLRSDITYILVFTTFGQHITGPFSVIASGPDDVFLNPININTP